MKFTGSAARLVAGIAQEPARAQTVTARATPILTCMLRLSARTPDTVRGNVAEAACAKPEVA